MLCHVVFRFIKIVAKGRIEIWKSIANSYRPNIRDLSILNLPVSR